MSKEVSLFLTVPFLPTEYAGWPHVIVQGDKLELVYKVSFGD